MGKQSNSRNLLKSSRDLLFSRVYGTLTRLENELNNLQTQTQVQFQQLEDKLNNSGHIKISDTEVMAKIFSGAKMYLDPRDIGLVPHLILDGDWERNITNAWLSSVRAGDVVLDIGANFGYFGVLAAQQANRNCNVVMFEANPQLQSYLRKTATVNSFSGCMVVENYAIADKKGSLTLNILKDYIASSSIHDVQQLNKYNQNGATFELESSVEVPAITIDEYCKQNKLKAVNLIKMDIEGYEEQAYKGMRNTVKESPDITLFIEFTHQAYKDPVNFYNTMLKDFGNVYTIDEKGQMSKPSKNDYQSVIGEHPEWAMPVFSKNRDLAK